MMSGSYPGALVLGQGLRSGKPLLAKLRRPKREIQCLSCLGVSVMPGSIIQDIMRRLFGGRSGSLVEAVSAPRQIIIDELFQGLILSCILASVSMSCQESVLKILYGIV